MPIRITPSIDGPHLSWEENEVALELVQDGDTLTVLVDNRGEVADIDIPVSVFLEMASVLTPRRP